jgi:hypothetical protein
MSVWLLNLEIARLKEKIDHLNNPGTGTVIPMRMGGLHQSVLRTTPSGDIELSWHNFSEEDELNGRVL